MRILRPSNSHGSAVSAETFDDVKRRLAEAIARPVRWREVMGAMAERGARRFVEEAWNVVPAGA